MELEDDPKARIKKGSRNLCFNIMLLISRFYFYSLLFCLASLLRWDLATPNRITTLTYVLIS